MSVFAGIFERLVEKVVWHPLHLFCMSEKFGLFSALQCFNSSCFLHFSFGNGFHGTKDCPQANILNLVQFVGVCLGCCHPGTLNIYQRWSDCPCVVHFQNLGAGVPDSFFRTGNFLMPFVSMLYMCSFHVRWVSSFTPRKVGVSTWGNVLPASFMATFSLAVEREKTVKPSDCHGWHSVVNARDTHI